MSDLPPNTRHNPFEPSRENILSALSFFGGALTEQPASVTQTQTRSHEARAVAAGAEPEGEYDY
jgi:hypothetical protein